jgi:hypothetical protein
VDAGHGVIVATIREEITNVAINNFGNDRQHNSQQLTLIFRSVYDAQGRGTGGNVTTNR